MVDVYSFGILLWALATTNEPYAGSNMNPFQLMAKVVDGYRPSTDELTDMVPPKLVQMMTDCWAPLPGDRPDFAELVLSLKAQRKTTLASIASGDGSNHSGHSKGGGGGGGGGGGNGGGRVSAV